MTATDVLLGDVLLRGAGNGYGWHLGELTGWYDLPDSKADFEERPQAHGAFGPGRDWRESAKVSVEGWFGASDRRELLAARRALTALGVRPGLVPLTVTDEDGPTTREVSIRFLDVPDDHGQLVFTFSMDTLAPDVFRYGPPVVASTTLATPGKGVRFPIRFPINFGAPATTGRVTTSNVGNAETQSLFSVTGGAMTGGFSLVEVPTGRRIVVIRDVPAGSTVALDPRTGELTLDGSLIPSYLQRAEWWSVPAGRYTEVQFLANGAVTGTPVLTATTSPAYL